jgi:hypothetical protein
MARACRTAICRSLWIGAFVFSVEAGGSGAGSVRLGWNSFR